MKSFLGKLVLILHIITQSISKHVYILVNPSPQNILFPDELQAFLCSVIISLHHEMIELCDRGLDVSTGTVSTSEVIVERRSLFHIDKYSSFKSRNTPIESEEPDPPSLISEKQKGELRAQYRSLHS